MLASTDPGLRVGDIQSIIAALNNLNIGSTSANLTATPAGTQLTSLLLGNAINEVKTVASANDGVLLPPAQPGLMRLVVNAAGANSLQVFGSGSDTINGTAGATGVAQAAAKSALYWSPVIGVWYRLLSA